MTWEYQTVRLSLGNMFRKDEIFVLGVERWTGT